MRKMVVILALLMAILAIPVKAGGFSNLPIDYETARKAEAAYSVVKALRGVNSREFDRIAVDIDRGLEREYGFTSEGFYRAQRILIDIEPNSRHLPKLRILNTIEINAFATTGYLYLTTGLLECASDSELAGAIGHEFAHVKLGHNKQAIRYERLARGAGGVLVLAECNNRIAEGLETAALLSFLKYTRRQELEADKYGAEMAYRAGYRHDGLARLLRKLPEPDFRRIELLNEQSRRKERIEVRKPKRVESQKSKVKSRHQPEHCEQPVKAEPPRKCQEPVRELSVEPRREYRPEPIRQEPVRQEPVYQAPESNYVLELTAKKPKVPSEDGKAGGFTPPPSQQTEKPVNKPTFQQPQTPAYKTTFQPPAMQKPTYQQPTQAKKQMAYSSKSGFQPVGIIYAYGCVTLKNLKGWSQVINLKPGERVKVGSSIVFYDKRKPTQKIAKYFVTNVQNAHQVTIKTIEENRAPGLGDPFKVF